MNKRHGQLATAALITLLALSGCGKEPPAPSAQQPKPAPAAGAKPTPAQPATAEVRELPYPGYQAPKLQAVDVVSGQPVSLEALRGKPVLLNFWATWCPPCRIEMPDLQKVHATYGQKVWVVGVGGDPREEAPKLQAYFKEMGLSFANWIDLSGEGVKAYRVQGLPTSVFIDPTGVVKHRIAGAATFQQMIEGLNRAGAGIE